MLFSEHSERKATHFLPSELERKSALNRALKQQQPGQSLAVYLLSTYYELDAALGSCVWKSDALGLP